MSQAAPKMLQVLQFSQHMATTAAATEAALTEAVTLYLYIYIRKKKKEKRMCVCDFVCLFYFASLNLQHLCKHRM